MSTKVAQDNTRLIYTVYTVNVVRVAVCLHTSAIFHNRYLKCSRQWIRRLQSCSLRRHVTCQLGTKVSEELLWRQKQQLSESADIQSAQIDVTEDSNTHLICGSVSSVGIATNYVLDGPGIESRWERGFSLLSRPALGPTLPPVQCVPGLSRE
jgi:hypothetical protein